MASITKKPVGVLLFVYYLRILGCGVNLRQNDELKKLRSVEQDLLRVAVICCNGSVSLRNPKG